MREEIGRGKGRAEGKPKRGERWEMRMKQMAELKWRGRSKKRESKLKLREWVKERRRKKK